MQPAARCYLGPMAEPRLLAPGWSQELGCCVGQRSSCGPASPSTTCAAHYLCSPPSLFLIDSRRTCCDEGGLAAGSPFPLMRREMSIIVPAPVDCGTEYQLIDSVKLVIPGRREAANPESSNLRQ